jgi:hypothetical protein
MSKLNALKIKSITKIGMHSDGNGLYLKVQPSSNNSTINKSWIFRWGAQGKKSMGLGSVKDITLAEARDLAIECSRLYARGLDPKEERAKIHAEKKAEKENSITFSDASKQYIEIHKASWENKKHGQQWENTLKTYAFDVIGNKSCSAVTKESPLSIKAMHSLYKFFFACVSIFILNTSEDDLASTSVVCITCFHSRKLPFH